MLFSEGKDCHGKEPEALLLAVLIMTRAVYSCFYQGCSPFDRLRVNGLDRYAQYPSVRAELVEARATIGFGKSICNLL